MVHIHIFENVISEKKLSDDAIELISNIRTSDGMHVAKLRYSEDWRSVLIANSKCQ